MDFNTSRGLSCDGGGARGYFSIVWLKLFCNMWGVPSNELWKYFTMGGTSIGGILVLALAYGKSIEEIEPFFLNLAKRLFTTRTGIEKGLSDHNASSDSLKPEIAQKVFFVATGETFYESPYTDSNYGSNILHNALVDMFGTATMQSLKNKVIIPAFQDNTKQYVRFSNHQHPMYIGQDARIVDVARATSAAPAYLPHYSFGGNRYKDGGIFENNTGQQVLNLARSLKPRSKRACLLSLGTGIGEAGFDAPGVVEPVNTGVQGLASLLDIAMTGGQEAVDFNLQFEATNILSQLSYYRMQKILDPLQDTELDSTTPAVLAYLEETAHNAFNDDSVNIATFLGKLTA